MSKGIAVAMKAPLALPRFVTPRRVPGLGVLTGETITSEDAQGVPH